MITRMTFQEYKACLDYCEKLAIGPPKEIETTIPDTRVFECETKNGETYWFYYRSDSVLIGKMGAKSSQWWEYRYFPLYLDSGEVDTLLSVLRETVLREKMSEQREIDVAKRKKHRDKHDKLQTLYGKIKQRRLQEELEGKGMRNAGIA